MPRIRTIKPDFWTSEQIVECSTNARLMFVGLWNFCDDGGTHPASAVRLKMEVFPGDNFTTEQIDGWIGELISAGLLVEFEADGRSWWHVTGWKHQKIDRPSIRFPQPEFDEHSSNDRRTLVDGHPPEKEKEKEKEKEVRGKKRIFATEATDAEKKPKRRGRRPAVTVGDVTFPDEMDTPDVRIDLERWLTHRRRIHKPYKSAEAVGALLSKWKSAGPDEFRKAVDHSIANEYQGLFGEKNNGRTTTNRIGAGQRYEPDAVASGHGTL